MNDLSIFYYLQCSGNINGLEIVQVNAIKVVLTLENKSYGENITNLRIYTLDTRNYETV